MRYAIDCLLLRPVGYYGLYEYVTLRAFEKLPIPHIITLRNGRIHDLGIGAGNVYFSQLQVNKRAIAGPFEHKSFYIGDEIDELYDGASSFVQLFSIYENDLENGALASTSVQLYLCTD